MLAADGGPFQFVAVVQIYFRESVTEDAFELVSWHLTDMLSREHSLPMTTQPKKIPVLVKGNLDVRLSALKPIQGELKELSNEDFILLRTKILSGIKFVFHVWKPDPSVSEYFIIDGHGRDNVLRHLVHNEQYEEPMIPCALVQAETLEEAKKLVLDSSSTFHRLRPEGLRNFMNELHLKPVDLENYRLLEVNLPIFTREYFPETIEKVGVEPEEKETVSFDAYKNASIKQITLLYSSDEYEVAIKKLEELASKFGVEDFSQVVWRLLASQS